MREKDIINFINLKKFCTDLVQRFNMGSWVLALWKGKKCCKYGVLDRADKNQLTPARTLSITGLKYRVLKLSFLSLNIMVKIGLEFILKFTEPLQRYLLSCQANSAILGRYFCTGQLQLWRGSVNFKIKSLDHFLPSFLSKKR